MRQGSATLTGTNLRSGERRVLGRGQMVQVVAFELAVRPADGPPAACSTGGSKQREH